MPLSLFCLHSVSICLACLFQFLSLCHCLFLSSAFLTKSLSACLNLRFVCLFIMLVCHFVSFLSCSLSASVFVSVCLCFICLFPSVSSSLPLSDWLSLSLSLPPPPLSPFTPPPPLSLSLLFSASLAASLYCFTFPAFLLFEHCRDEQLH